MDTAQSPQQGLDSSMRSEPQVESRLKPHKEQALNCPRCTSTNTKFCYYNNYSLSQPRYFCKTCKRYWTEGGFLRNVPVGGGSRRNNKRSSSSTTKLVASASSSLLHAQHCPEFKTTLSKNPTNVRPASCTQQLSVVSSYESIIPFGTYKGGQVLNLSSTNQTYALDLTRSEISARMLDPFVAPVPMPSAAAAYGDGFGLQELKRSSNDLKLPWDEVVAGGYGGNMQDLEGGGDGELLFPFEDLTQIPISNDSGAVMENGTETTLFWNGVMGNGGRGGRGGGEESW